MWLAGGFDAQSRITHHASRITHHAQTNASWKYDHLIN
jgi:hypothetical protein